MSAYLNFLRAFSADESGATAVEYGLILASLSMVVALAASTVGESIRTVLLEKVAAALAG